MLPYSVGLGIFSSVVATLYTLRKYREYQWGYFDSKKKMREKIVIITGANSGIGKEAAVDLASRGATVVLACRNEQATLEVIREIKTQFPESELIFMELDLSSLESVKKCAKKICEKFDRIDVLINNAGVAMPPEFSTTVPTKEGFEVHFGVNHLGHFLFTNLLLDVIKKTPNSRIVIVSSGLYKNGEINFDSIAWPQSVSTVKKRKGRNPLYSDSKLCNILHGQELSKILEGTKTSVLTLCPGFTRTGLFRYFSDQYNWIKKLCFLPIIFFFMRSAKQGAQTVIYCAVSEDLNGKDFGFFQNCKEGELNDVAKNHELASKLWHFSDRMIKLKTGKIADNLELENIE